MEKMYAKVGLDMDGVIVNFTGKFLPRINEVLNLNLTEDDLTISSIYDVVYPYLTGDQKRLFSNRDIFYSTLTPEGFYKDLEPYAGAIDAIRELKEDNNDIYIITRPAEWLRCPGEKKWWIDKYLGEFDLPFYMVSQMEGKSLIHTDILIDDDPRVLKNLDYTIGVAIKHPWNKEYLDFEPTHTIDSLVFAPSIVNEIKKELFY